MYICFYSMTKMVMYGVTEVVAVDLTIKYYTDSLTNC